jgi:hypothetical protein
MRVSGSVNNKLIINKHAKRTDERKSKRCVLLRGSDRGCVHALYLKRGASSHPSPSNFLWRGPVLAILTPCFDLCLSSSSFFDSCQWQREFEIREATAAATSMEEGGGLSCERVAAAMAGINKEARQQQAWRCW